MKTVEHKLYPVSYLNDDGEQIDTLYTWSPSHVAPDNWVGEPITVQASHADDIRDKSRAARIADLKKTLAKLEAQS